jgi:NitT/TauT family transport system permease protein
MPEGRESSVVSDTAVAGAVIASVPGHREDRSLRHLGHPMVWAPTVVAIGIVAVVWQILALHNPYDLPRIGAIWQALSNRPRLFLRDAASTLLEMAVGLMAGFVVAFLLAVAMCHSRIVDRAVMPLAVTLNVTPIIALAPGLAIAFGFGYLPKFVIAAIIVFFPFLVNSLTGLRDVDPEALDVFRTLDASRWEILVRLRIPSSLPFLFAAARICFPLAVVGAVVADFVANSTTPGLGRLFAAANQGGGAQTLPTTYAGVVVLALIGLLLTLGVSFLETRLLSWHTASRRTR